MPTKPNRAGNQQNYVPAGNGDASGEYSDNATGSNIHFVNFKKPDEVKQQESDKQETKNIGVKIKNEGKEQPDISTIKPHYNGKGQELLADVLINKLPKGKNVKILLQNISEADDEYSGIIADFYKANPAVKLKLGANLRSYYSSSWYENEIQVGQGMFKDSDNYSKGGIFFHESGHALDDTYIDELGHKGHWSSEYISKKYGKSINEQIYTEITNYFGDSKKVDEFIAQIKKEEQEESTSKFAKYEQEYSSLKVKENQASKKALEDEIVVKLNKEADDMFTEIIDFKQKNNFIPQYVFDSSGYHKTDEYIEYEKKYEELMNRYRDKCSEKNVAFNNAKSKYFSPQEEARCDELFDLKFKIKKEAEHNKQVKYGDLSDMVQAVFGKTLTGMGHDHGYFSSKNKRGKEAFAEIMSAKATNPASLEVMKKIIPQTLEIFDEIMGEIRNGKNSYKKQG